MRSSIVHHCLTLFMLSICLSSFSAADTIGPHPSDVSPTSYERPELKDVEIPIIKSGCVLPSSSSPNVTYASLVEDFYAYPLEQIEAGFSWCRGSVRQTGGLRYRVLELFGTDTDPETKVLEAHIDDSLSLSTNLIHPGCFPRRVYAEACARVSANARPLCAMTKIFTVDRDTVPEPRLSWRPPYMLELKTGDSARFVTRIQNATRFDNRFSNDRDSAPRRFLTRYVIKDKNGRMLRKTPLKERSWTQIRIGKRQTSGWRVNRFNGSTAELEFALHSCPSNIGSYGARYRTTIIISEDVKSLVKQDIKLPKFKTPKFTAIESGEDTSATVEATNIGGGLREGDIPTKLTYQWNHRYNDGDYFGPSYAYGIRGETNETLELESVSCSAPEAGSYEIIGYKHYYVDVCNTFGCRRSDLITPRYISNNGSIITDEDC